MPPLSVRREKLWFSTMPCVSRLVNGSSMRIRPMSRIALVQKRA